ncbi:MAG: DUF4097 family beta strand repeat-containing protein [Acidobacteriota bacterium]|jgi:DUF4097 and DUF4098 domain-containing protein YvlB|nr:DUF4097 family beta strand repeat-containing protein [Acidobacteriota bacterium]
MLKRMMTLVWLTGLMVVPLQVFSSAEKTFEVKPGQRLVVDLKAGGRIEVTGWEKSSVRLEAMFKGKTSEKMPFDVRRIDDGIEVKTRLAGGLDSLPGSHGDYTLKVLVPQKFDLKLSSMGGNIQVAGVSGEISGRTMGGDLDLKRLGGVVYMKTMGGDVSLRDSHVDGEVRTMGGRVLLEDVVGDVKGSSMGGNVIYRNVKKKPGDSGSDNVVRVSTMGGAVNVDDAPRGADLHTMGGPITVKSAAGFVKAKTMGGDIRLESVDGWIEAKTLSGDVTARVTGDSAGGDRHVEITSHSGDIELTVPEKLSMDVEIRVTIYKNGHNDYRIKNDFNLKVEADSEWVEKDGKQVKILRASGRTGDGRNKVVLHTINGNVTLRKAGKK